MGQLLYCTWKLFHATYYTNAAFTICFQVPSLLAQSLLIGHMQAQFQPNGLAAVIGAMQCVMEQLQGTPSPDVGTGPGGLPGLRDMALKIKRWNRHKLWRAVM